MENPTEVSVEVTQIEMVFGDSRPMHVAVRYSVSISNKRYTGPAGIAESDLLDVDDVDLMAALKTLHSTLEGILSKRLGLVDDNFRLIDDAPLDDEEL